MENLPPPPPPPEVNETEYEEQEELNAEDLLTENESLKLRITSLESSVNGLTGENAELRVAIGANDAALDKMLWSHASRNECTSTEELEAKWELHGQLIQRKNKI